MLIVHPVQEGVVMSDHTWRIFDFETETEAQAEAFAEKAKSKGWKTWCIGYTVFTHAALPSLEHGGCMVKVIKAPTGPNGEPCACRYCS